MILGNLFARGGGKLHWVAASVMCAIYLYNLPLAFAVQLDARGLRFGVGVFRARMREKKSKRKKPDENPLKKIIPMRLVLRMLARRPFKLELLDVDVTIGTGDAALTAQMCGLLILVLDMLRAATNAVGHVRVTPDFTKRALAGEARGIALIKTGHIMKAALLYKLRGAGG